MDLGRLRRLRGAERDMEIERGEGSKIGSAKERERKKEEKTSRGLGSSNTIARLFDTLETNKRGEEKPSNHTGGSLG